MKLSFLQTLTFIFSVFLSAFLLFMVQPLFSKMILPVLGGSAAVWTTSMLFFQIMLLLGYIYAHMTAKHLAPRSQIILHIFLIISACVLLPFEFGRSMLSLEHPAIWVLIIATTTVGWPFFVLSASAPLLQRWFSFTSHPRRDNPYFLYAASNFGSMFALLGYPFLIERYVGLGDQKHLWYYLYLALMLSFVVAGLIIFKNTKQEVFSKKNCEINPKPILVFDKIIWVLFAFIPSSLMLGLTSFITMDIAAVSLFWVIPLALYLLTFILVFSEIKQPSYKFFSIALGLTSLLLAIILLTSGDKFLQIILNTLLFFFFSWFFHERLASSKPAPAHLTQFYIWMAFGGMLGGIFNAVVVPFIFNFPLEYLLTGAFALVVFLIIGLRKNLSQRDFIILIAKRFMIISVILFIADILMSSPITDSVRFEFTSLALVLMVVMAFSYYKGRLRRFEFLMNSLFLLAFCVLINFLSHKILFADRSFYGSMRVLKEIVGEEVTHTFGHGTTNHGIQIVEPVERRKDIVSYFHPAGAFGDIARGFIAEKQEPLSIGILGLGSGLLSCYANKKDEVIFFEIDKKVEDIARDSRYFTFLDLCPAEVVIGDGRFTLQDYPDQRFDILYMDAFSSDAVPTHLLTQEAIDSYLSKLKPQGPIVVHISNRYLNLSKVVANYTLPEGYGVYYSKQRQSKERHYNQQLVALIAHENNLPQEIRSEHWEKLNKDPTFRDWTDDFTNIVSVFHAPSIFK